MSRKIILIIILATIIVNIFTQASYIQPVKAEGTIYIRSDGTIYPSTAPIQRNLYIYTFTADISDSIVVERDNIVVDGAGYNVQGTGDKGLTISGINNVTIKNVKIKGFTIGIWLYNSSNIKISGNEIIGSQAISGEEYGIYLSGLSNNNTISGNKITKTGNGIGLYGPSSGIHSHNNTVLGNEISANVLNGVYLDANSTKNRILRNNITNNGLVGGNGIILYASKNNTILGNNIINDRTGIRLYGWSANNTISENNIAENLNGIVLEGDVTDTNNLIYHDNFVDNNVQVTVVAGYSWSVWDNGYPSGGNYWSDYTGTDDNGDGIGDSPYVIDDKNRDRYPLMNPYGDTTPPTVSIVSPENKTYSANHIPLTFYVSETALWFRYSLDNQMNLTITQNTTLSGLSEGSHNIVVYAKDIAGNTGSSETIFFTIKIQQVVPIWIVAPIVILAVGAALLVYLKKLKK